ncbi:MAG: cobyric acid synthase [Desulfuromonadales bacterium]|nr:cobyric acid synthase [Desulfuromonadales bacterium]
MAQLYVVGLGPGDLKQMTPACSEALDQSTVVIGYKTYIDLIAPLLAGKEVIASGMMSEVDRCRQALKIAATGKIVALVSSGDAGIYGMAGLVLELANEPESSAGDVDIEMIPGVSAVQAAAAALGAPLMHDFSVISLSDLLTPWPLIRRRLDAAGSADFVVALYNPRSKGRPDHLETARRILLRHRAPDTPVGIVRNATRAKEMVLVDTLGGFDLNEVDMLSLMIIGNSQTVVDHAGRMITPRGYAARYLHTDNGATPASAAPNRARGLFIGGTGSDVGKSLITAGLCRLLKRRTIDVAPFKAQNMALNSAATPQGGEIGRAQALQAAACGLPAHVDMNPVLLKPNSVLGSQVVIAGKSVGNMSVAEYHAYKPIAFTEVCAAYNRLAAQHEVILLEGAGSIAEVNLRQHDITNLKAAAMADAAVLLVADIDRGGVFAAILGTLQLLTPDERNRIAGVIINRFRGDVSLLAPGIAEIEERTGVPVLGVVPWIDLHLPEEDSVALDRKPRVVSAATDRLTIGVVRLPRISNYSDFDPFEAEVDVDLIYLEDPAHLAACDLVILPGTKSTLDDLATLKQNGFATAILDFQAAGGRVIGICGGFQMLGQAILDPGRLESAQTEACGLGLLGITTRLAEQKQTHQVRATLHSGRAATGLAAQAPIIGYEIHLGESCYDEGVQALFTLVERSGEKSDLLDGACSADGRVWGCYLHGLFDNDTLRHSLLTTLRSEKGLVARDLTLIPTIDAELDRLADHLEAHLDLGRILSLVAVEKE